MAGGRRYDVSVLFPIEPGGQTYLCRLVAAPDVAIRKEAEDGICPPPFRLGLEVNSGDDWELVDHGS